MSLESILQTIKEVLADSKESAKKRQIKFQNTVDQLTILGRDYFTPLVLAEYHEHMKAEETRHQKVLAEAEEKRKALEVKVRAKLGEMPVYKISDKIKVTHITPDETYVYKSEVTKVDGYMITVTSGILSPVKTFSWCCHQLYDPVSYSKYIERVEIIPLGKEPSEIKELPDLTEEEIRSVPGLIEYYSHLKGKCKYGLMKIGDELITTSYARGERGTYWVTDRPFKVEGTIAGGHFFWYYSFKGYGHSSAHSFDEPGCNLYPTHLTAK